MDFGLCRLPINSLITDLIIYQILGKLKISLLVHNIKSVNNDFVTSETAPITIKAYQGCYHITPLV